MGAAVEAGPVSAALARRVREAARAGGVSQRALAGATGISVGRVNALLGGGRPWYLEDVGRVCAALGLDVHRTLLDAWKPGA